MIASLSERGEKSDRGVKVFDDNADVVQTLDGHVLSIAVPVRGGPLKVRVQTNTAEFCILGKQTGGIPSLTNLL
jgi:hypothetical protein